jgi:hypothetical protein
MCIDGLLSSTITRYDPNTRVDDEGIEPLSYTFQWIGAHVDTLLSNICSHPRFGDTFPSSSGEPLVPSPPLHFALVHHVQTITGGALCTSYSLPTPSKVRVQYYTCLA